MGIGTGDSSLGLSSLHAMQRRGEKKKKKTRGRGKVVTRLQYGVTGQSNAAMRSTADSPIGYK